MVQDQISPEELKELVKNLEATKLPNESFNEKMNREKKALATEKDKLTREGEALKLEKEEKNQINLD
jgi:hypothetical protein